jgi:hypothetical protein
MAHDALVDAGRLTSAARGVTSDPGFWFPVAAQLQAGDIVECVRDDLAFYGRVIVTSAFGTRITVAPLDHVEIDVEAPTDLTERSGFKVENGGLVDKHVIIRLADNHVMERGIETAELANQIIRQDLMPWYRKRGFG